MKMKKFFKTLKKIFWVLIDVIGRCVTGTALLEDIEQYIYMYHNVKHIVFDPKSTFKKLFKEDN